MPSNPEHNSKYVNAFYERQRNKGLVLVREWVPIKRKAELKALCKDWRAQLNGLLVVLLLAGCATTPPSKPQQVRQLMDACMEARGGFESCLQNGFGRLGLTPAEGEMYVEYVLAEDEMQAYAPPEPDWGRLMMDLSAILHAAN